MKLARMKVVEMRKELDARGLDSTGTRPTLMKRLREALDREDAGDVGQEQSNQSRATDQTKHAGNAAAENRNNDRQDPALIESRAMAAEETVDGRGSERLPPATDRSPSPSQKTPPVNEPAQITDTGESPASDSIGRGISMDERMQKRRERFGTTSNAPDTTDDAIQRRRRRFGIVQRDAEDKPGKRRRPSTEVDKQALREHLEAKKRRAVKFGISLNTGKEPGTDNPITADEIEKRLKRQRRFQHVGS